MKIEQYEKINKNWSLYNNRPLTYALAINNIIEEANNNEQLVLENLNEVKDFLSKIGGELKNATKFITTFGTGVAAFYPAISRLLENSSISITKQETMLVIVTAISMLVHSPDAEKLKLKVREKGLIKSLYGIVDFLRNYSKFMGTIRNKSTDVASSLMDMLGYTALLVPSVAQITKLINQEQITLDDTRKLFIGLGTSATAYGIKTLIDKTREKEQED